VRGGVSGSFSLVSAARKLGGGEVERAAVRTRAGQLVDREFAKSEFREAFHAGRFQLFTSLSEQASKRRKALTSRRNDLQLA
jgi:hypothetical protein